MSCSILSAGEIGDLTNIDVMTGFNGTLFCYGQTGSGKTYSELHFTYKVMKLKPISYDGQLLVDPL